MQEVWWEKLFQNETTTVDVGQIDCSRPIGELPEETQAHLNQIQFDQRQRLKGDSDRESSLSCLIINVFLIHSFRRINVRTN